MYLKGIIDMKKYRTALILITLVLCSTACFAQDSLGTKIKLQQPYSTSSNESENHGHGSSDNSINDSMINSSLGAMSNMINGCNTNMFSAHELQQQQLDYSRQQAESSRK